MKYGQNVKIFDSGKFELSSEIENIIAIIWRTLFFLISNANIQIKH